MERFATISIAVSAAIAGFFIGLYGAAKFGLHEPLHVFVPATISALVVATISVALIPNWYRRLDASWRRPAMLFSGILLAGSLAFFWRTIS